MPWRGPEVPGEFPTLGPQVGALIEDRCAIPDGEHVGEPYLLTEEMLVFLDWYYRLDPRTGRFYFQRGAQLVRPQKWGKGPFSAAIVCAECSPDGPVRFAGWDANGEPVGKPVPTPWWQITAVSGDQTDNVWTALLPMIELGALAADITETGLTRIFLPYGGKIEPVTSSAQSRLGQRINGAVQDQTESWLPSESGGGRMVADTQRRNLAGMGGRFMETCNAWDPNQNSVAQQTSENREPGVYFNDIEPDEELSIRRKGQRRQMLEQVYGNAAKPDATGIGGWVDLDRIDIEIVTLLKRDPAQAERYYGNRKLAGEARAFRMSLYKRLAEPRVRPEPGSLIVIGVDGARFRDALAIVATAVEQRHMWPIGIWERPKDSPEDYEHPQGQIDGTMLDAFEEYYVWRVYIDPGSASGNIENLMEKWQGRWGEKRVLPWLMNRPKQTAWAVRNYTDAIAGGDFTHDDDPKLVQHHRQAVKQPVNTYDDKRRQMHVISKDRPDSPRFMDGAAASVLSWEACGDAIAADAKPPASAKLVTFT